MKSAELEPNSKVFYLSEICPEKIRKPEGLPDRPFRKLLLRWRRMQPLGLEWLVRANHRSYLMDAKEVEHNAEIGKLASTLA
jgi:hypothetical protein